MGWDGTGYRVTEADMDILRRSGTWVQDLYESRQRFLLDPESNRGLLDPVLCWDDLPPATFDRRRRIHAGHSTIISVAPNTGEDLPGTLSESLWSALEGGRGVLTARLAHEIATLQAIQDPTRERQQVRELGAREYAELRRRVIDRGRLENSLILGIERPVVLRECTFSSCEFLRCEFRGVVFRRCSFVKCTFGGCIFRSCVFEDCDWDASRWGLWQARPVTLMGPDGEEKEAKATRTRLYIDWASANRVERSRVEGRTNSIKDAEGFGPAAFMPGRLGVHFSVLCNDAWDEWNSLRAEHAERVEEGRLEGKPVTLTQKCRMHAARETAKAKAKWQAGTKQDARNPDFILDGLRGRYPMEDDLMGFQFAV